MSNQIIKQSLTDVKEIKRFAADLETAAELVADLLARLEAGDVTGLVELLNPLCEGNSIRLPLTDPTYKLYELLEETT